MDGLCVTRYGSEANGIRKWTILEDAIPPHDCHVVCTTNRTRAYTAGRRVEIRFFVGGKR